MAYFPEPEIPDPTWGAFGEDQVDWLRRSTLVRAASIRAALNENLGHIPEPWAGRLARRLVTAWRSSYFELIVGRTLQELGADITPEPIGTNGTKIDYLARFPDGAVTVEAVSKVYNPGADAERRRKGAVVERIRPMIPAGWSLLAEDVPERWSDELEAVVRDWLLTLGPPVAGANVELDHSVDGHEIQLIAVEHDGDERILAGPVVGYVSDAPERIRAALRHGRKRAQARGAAAAPFLAIDGGILAAHDYDFDRALLGGDHDQYWLDHKLMGRRFVASGELAKDPTCPWVGVLAFYDVGPFRATEPVLYLSPHANSWLPRAFLDLERRELAVRPSDRVGDPVMTRVAFGRPFED